MNTPERKRSGSPEWLTRALLMLVSVLIALLLAEGLTRLVHPVSERRDNIDMDGRLLLTWLEPGSKYRQVSNEYDALTTITDKGHRAPAVVGNPDVIFIGDSFTFGYGLKDDETFASIYCAQLQLQCANLGIPGSGTLRQLEKLEESLLTWGWRPREVKLFFFAMSSSFSAGNDFVDNYNRARAEESAKSAGRAGGDTPQPAGGLGERIIGLQRFLLRNSNLVRMTKFYAGPALKSMLLAEPGEERMKTALSATAGGLRRLDELGKQYGFEYSIYLIVPVHDVLRQSYPQTHRALSGVAPRPVISTAEVFVDSPTRYYYAFDGHLNAQGSRRLAEFLLSLDKKRS